MSQPYWTTWMFKKHACLEDCSDLYVSAINSTGKPSVKVYWGSVYFGAALYLLTALVHGKLSWFCEKYFICLCSFCGLCLIPEGDCSKREVILKVCELWLLSAWILHQNVPFLVDAPFPANTVTTPILLMSVNNYNLLNNADLWIILVKFCLQYCYQWYLALFMTFLTLREFPLASYNKRHHHQENSSHSKAVCECN